MGAVAVRPLKDEHPFTVLVRLLSLDGADDVLLKGNPTLFRRVVKLLTTDHSEDDTSAVEILRELVKTPMLKLLVNVKHNDSLLNLIKLL